MTAYYNEIDPKAAATLRELITAGHIAPGFVDTRSIEDVLPSELTGYTQVHLFAGFGIWSLALRSAGWEDSRPVWTASCPCQPFSQAGKGAGFSDERHLWPAAFWLIQHGKVFGVPVYGEQVASPDGLRWLDLIQSDLEGIGHSCRYVVLASAGFGAPIIRQRTYWMARARCAAHRGRGPSGERWGTQLTDGCPVSRMECSQSNGRQQRGTESSERGATGRRSSSGLGSALNSGLEGYAGNGDGTSERYQPLGSATETSTISAERPGPTNGFWRAADWLRCRDDKWRPVEPGTFPLAHGYPERVGILRGAGNAISPQVAAAWIKVTM